MSIEQAAIHWIRFNDQKGSSLRGTHPAVIMQATHINNTAINTVVVVGITSNLKLSSIPGNIFLKKGQGNLPKDSVVNTSQIHTIDKAYIEEKIGNLTPDQFQEILIGIDHLFDRR